MTPHRPSRRLGSARPGLPILAVVLLLAACTATAAPTPTPGPTPPPSHAPSDAPATPEPSPSPSVDPTPPPRTDLPWVVVDIPEAPEHSAILEIVGGDEGLVALGHDGAFGSIAWRLTDLDGWWDATPADFASIGIASAVEFDDRIIAVGRGQTTNVDVSVAAVVVSEDGSTWTTVPTDLAGQLIEVIATSDGLVAVGGVPGADAAGVLRSSDGETWEPLGQDLEHAFLWSVTEGGPGLVAVGWRRNPDPQLAVWTSADGGDWELAPDVPDAAGMEATHVVTAPDGTLVMTGSAFDGSGGRIWTSADGRAWEPADVDMEGGYARRLAVTPWGVVALGGRDMSAVAWVSFDHGTTWTQLGDVVPNAHFIDAFATDGGQLIAMGSTQEGTVETGITGAAALWAMAFR